MSDEWPGFVTARELYESDESYEEISVKNDGAMLYIAGDDWNEFLCMGDIPQHLENRC